MVNPDDGRRGALVADANVPADAAGQGGVPGLRGLPERTGADVTAQGGETERQTVSFRTSGLVIELEITGSGESRQMAGRLIPAQSGVVEIRGVIAVEADARGRFTADAVPPGQVSVRCRLGTDADRARIATGWVAL
jgi:hypothetical protein